MEEVLTCSDVRYLSEVLFCTIVTHMSDLYINPLSASHSYCCLLCHLLVVLKVIFANSVDLKEQSDQGPHCLPVCKNRFEKFARIFSRWHIKQTTFSDAGFLGALRVKDWLKFLEAKCDSGKLCCLVIVLINILPTKQKFYTPTYSLPPHHTKESFRDINVFSMSMILYSLFLSFSQQLRFLLYNHFATLFSFSPWPSDNTHVVGKKGAAGSVLQELCLFIIL